MKSLIRTIFKSAGSRIFVPVTLVALIAIPLFCYSFIHRHTDKNEWILQMNMQLLKTHHFDPPQIDDRFSEKVFSAYLKALDPYKQYLTKEDIAEMDKYKLLIDNQISNNTYELYDLSILLWDKRFSETQSFYRDILSQPFDFNQDETYESDSDKTDWAANSSELKDRWRKELKYRVLSNVCTTMKSNETAADSVKNTSFEEIEADARKKVLKTYNDVYQYRSKLKEEDRFAMYVNAITSVFDPHTQYQTPIEKDNFEIQLSGQFEGIGATLQVSDGYAKVRDIVPGSASWMQGELKINDVIMRVKQEKEEEAVNIYGMQLDDAVKLIRGKKGTKVTLTVKSLDGTVHDITITRDVVILEETYAKSAILSDPDRNIKAGYIFLPSFYVDFKHDATGRSCADDVAKEVEKLKNEKVQGIILDLRSNGGGSLPEAVAASGLFVGVGPIVQTKANPGLPRVMTARGNVAYDGPMVILVNSISASASEIMAAAMQDYQRAIIIGGASTYGKGTVQMLADLDESFAGNATINGYKPLGLLKLTIQKFFRINGGSTQLKGVTPDIILPDIYSELGVGERFEDNSLPWTSVNPANYSRWKNPVPVEKVQQKSKARTAQSEDFQLFAEQIATMKKMKDESNLSLNMEKFRQAEEKRSAGNKAFDEFNKKETHLAIESLTADKSAMGTDTVKISRAKKWIGNLKKDIYLEEAVSVIGDMK
ncbi:MAG: carboxy terminal-processing peptidase [Bacteroidales bacterium]|jgi:carboxyl-terminal processing protease|nr:carboxy terminal-processing peptidase [Bacteroidales bacterium]